MPNELVTWALKGPGPSCGETGDPALQRGTPAPVAGLSQADLAKLLNTHQPAIARLENGLSDPRLTTIKKLATALGVSEAEVLEAIDSGRTVSQAS